MAPRMEDQRGPQAEGFGLLGNFMTFNEQNFREVGDGPDETPPTLPKLMRRAAGLYNAGSFESARRLLEALARAVPDATQVLYPLGCTYYRLHQYEDVLMICNRLARLGDTRHRKLRAQLADNDRLNPVVASLADARNRHLESSTEPDAAVRQAGRFMMDLYVSGAPEETLALMRAARHSNQRFVFKDKAGPGVTPIHITDHRQPVLSSVDRSRGILVSTYQLDGIGLYAGIDRGTCLLLGVMLGVTQWRTLQLNSLLVAEDFHHGPECACLFSHQHAKQNFALLLDEPSVCPSCIAFYRCLGAETEVAALTEFLGSVHTWHAPQDSSFPA